MNKSLIGFLLLFSFFSNAGAQKYDVPINIKSAYEYGSRDYSGKPGDKYFQNHSSYSIKAEFNPDKGLLKGSERIWYTNNSIDSLNYIVIRLYHDILRQGNSRAEEVPAEELTKGVTINSLVIDNVEYIDNPDIFLNRKGTNLIVTLPINLLPSDSLSVSIKWQTQLPHIHVHRFGYYRNSNWFVAYWYPQIAVYDDIDGWDFLSYTGTTEFYNDFADFDVEITVPGKHLLWATGDFLNPGQIFSKQVMKRYSESRAQEELVHVVGQKDWEMGSIFLNSHRNKFHFNAHNITDFAFAVSDNYIWDAQSSIIDTTAGAMITVNAVYPVDADNFEEIASFGAKSVKDFYVNSLKIAYPFRQVTVFNGDGGMEFPMMVNERADGKAENDFVTMHEIFHGYFPFMTGLNEKKYAWMDEGLTTYLPIITEEALGGHYFTVPKINNIYSMLAGEDVEAPLMFPSHLLNGFPYQHQAYFRSSAALYILEDYLGREKFREAIRVFVNRWKGKHPTGYDFIFSLEDTAGESLYWLIKPWFFDKGWADLELTSTSLESGQLVVDITNVGGLPVPVYVTVEKKDGTLVNKKFASDIWKENPKAARVVLADIEDFKKVTIGNPNIPDKDSSNNLKKSE